MGVTVLLGKYLYFVKTINLCNTIKVGLRVRFEGWNITPPADALQ